MPKLHHLRCNVQKFAKRPFLVSSAQASENKIHRMAGAAAVATLSGHGRNVRDVRELANAVREVGHILGHAFREIRDDFEEEAD